MVVVLYTPQTLFHGFIAVHSNQKESKESPKMKCIFLMSMSCMGWI